MRIFLISWLLGAVLLLGSESQASPSASASTRILLVVSGHGQDGGETRPGFEMDELAQAYAIFVDNGLGVDIASPVGGLVEADEYDASKPYNARMLADPRAMRLLADTRSLASVRAQDYAGIFIIGGKGAMFDLPRSAELRTLIARIWQGGGVVAAVCHGPAALVGVRLDAGRPLIAGRAVTGFSNEEEALFGERWMGEYPFQLEDALREGGGRFGEAEMMLPHLAVDGRLITGQNPFSTALAAEAVVRALGRAPVARTPWPDENGLTLVARFLAGERDPVRQALAAQPDAYDASIIGMYGAMRAQAAGDDLSRLADALALMELATPYFAHPRLQLAMADAERKLGRTSDARRRIERVLADRPDLEEARAMLAAIDG
jgi:putative intracellular protease/amidase